MEGVEKIVNQAVMGTKEDTAQEEADVIPATREAGGGEGKTSPRLTNLGTRRKDEEGKSVRTWRK